MAVLGALLLSLFGCAKPLPDAESPGARAYVRDCAACHPAYAPGSLTAAMWDVQVSRMDEIRQRRGLPPLDGADRALILDYLRTHAG